MHLIKESLVTLECKTHAIYAGGDHQILVGEVVTAIWAAPGRKGPLLYFRGKYAKLR